MRIRINPVTLLLLLLLALGKNILLPASLLAALIHECGHLLAARLCHVRIKLMEIDLFGAKLYPLGALSSYKAEILLAAAGPLFSLLLGAFLYPHGGVFVTVLRHATFSFAVFNLLPIREFDGGRILAATLLQYTSEPLARRVLAVSSYISLLFLFSLAACMLLRYGQNLALAVLSASLFVKLFLETK